MKECPKCGARYSNEATFCSKDASSLVEISADSDILGMVIDGRWRVDAKLGEGGMGAVYLGHQVNIDRKVAIKTLRRELTSSPEFMARFEQEARAAGKISHPNCVTVFESGRADTLGGMLYLVMEYLEGEVLSGRLVRRKLTIEETLKVAIQVASGLAAAHEMGIIHRDLKPDNIFLVNVPGNDIHAKVLDFGIAKISDGDSKMTKSGMIMGTPQYMSPEQCHGRSVDVRTDIYALGTIIYEMLSGRTPFNSPTPITVLFEVVNSAPPSLAELGVRVPVEIEAYVMRMLAKDADARPASAMEVKRELERLLMFAHQAPHRVETPMAVSATLPMPQPVTAAMPQKSSQAKQIGGIVMASLLLVGLVAGAWTVANSLQSTPTEDVAAVPQAVPQVPEAIVSNTSGEDASKSILASAMVVRSGLDVAWAALEEQKVQAVAVAPKPTIKKSKSAKSVPADKDELDKVIPEIEVASEQPVIKPKTQPKTTEPRTTQPRTLDELREARKSAKDASKKIKKVRKDFESVLDSLGPAP